MEFTFRLPEDPTLFRFDAARLAESHPRLRELRSRMLEAAGGDVGKVDNELAFRFFEALSNFGDTYVKQMSGILQKIFQTRDGLSALYDSVIKGEPVAPESLRAKYDQLAADLARLKPPEQALADAPNIELPPKEVTAEPDLSLGLDDFDPDAAVDDLEGQAQVPRVKRGKIDGITVRRAPKDPVKNAAFFARRSGRLDILDLVRRPGESFGDAAARVRTIIGRKLSQNESIRTSWDAARAKVLKGRPLESITRDEMLGHGEFEGKPSLYDQVRDQFWTDIGNAPGSKAAQALDHAGLKFGDGLAPNLEVSRAGIPPGETKVSLDHILEKAQGENWRKAIDADNLRFEFSNPNSFREAIQVRLKLRSPE
jgi:hypothetical protein